MSMLIPRTVQPDAHASLIGTVQPIQYQSCLISGRSQDEEFARRLHEKMRGEKLRVWFAPEDMQGGQSSHHRSA